MTGCLPCNPCPTAVPCVETWDLPLQDRPVETLTVRGDRL